MSLCNQDRTAVLDSWKYWHGKKYLLHAAVVMPDHVHVLVTPWVSGYGNWTSLSEILHSSKSFTAHQINKARGRRGSVWQDERYDRIVRDEAEFLEKWTYIANNPRNAGLVESMEEYPGLYQDPDAWRAAEGTGGTPVPPMMRMIQE
ncbi:MAG: transposase [Chloroflexi bacterium]|nr:transposase [Chloroflexota bacterium]